MFDDFLCEAQSDEYEPEYDIDALREEVQDYVGAGWCNYNTPIHQFGSAILADIDDADDEDVIEMAEEFGLI